MIKADDEDQFKATRKVGFPFRSHHRHRQPVRRHGVRRRAQHRRPILGITGRQRNRYRFRGRLWGTARLQSSFDLGLLLR